MHACAWSQHVFSHCATFICIQRQATNHCSSVNFGGVPRLRSLCSRFGFIRVYWLGFRVRCNLFLKPAVAHGWPRQASPSWSPACFAAKLQLLGGPLDPATRISCRNSGHMRRWFKLKSPQDLLLRPRLQHGSQAASPGRALPDL
jgi:hypothetical protein